MNARNLAGCLAGLIALLALAGCSGSAPQDTGDVRVHLPQYYGLYAVIRDQLVLIGGDSSLAPQNGANPQDLASTASFLVYSRDLASNGEPLDTAIVLKRMVRLRDVRTVDGTVIPTPRSWISPNLPGYRIALRFAPVSGHPDMIFATPMAPLPRGLYALMLHGTDSWSARFGIDGPETAEQQDTAQDCVEQLPSGFRPCGKAGGSGGSEFAVRAVHSTITNGGSAPSLVIRGELVNMSAVSERLPALRASLLDDQDKVVQVLPAVTLPKQSLAPGSVYDFRVDVTNPAPGAARARISPAA